MRRAGLILFGLALILAAGSWRPVSTFAQLPAGTPTYNVNAKWVTDRGSQVYNVKAYGATGNGTTHGTAAINATITAAGAGGHLLSPPGSYVVSSELVLLTNFQTFEGPGPYILCNQSTATTCHYAGSGTNANAVNSVTIQGLGFVPGPNSTTNSLIVDNAQNTKFVDLNGAAQSPAACSSQPGGNCHYGHFIENDHDQSETIGGYCINPLNDGNSHALGGAGLIILGEPVTAEGAGPGSVVGTVFSTNASGGTSTSWHYVGSRATGGTTTPLLAGHLNNGPATVSTRAVVYLGAQRDCRGRDKERTKSAESRHKLTSSGILPYTPPAGGIPACGKPQGRKCDFHELSRAEGPWGQTPERRPAARASPVTVPQDWSRKRSPPCSAA